MMDFLRNVKTSPGDSAMEIFSSPPRLLDRCLHLVRKTMWIKLPGLVVGVIPSRGMLE